MTIGASGMYVVPVVLPAVQADFGVARADASLPYTLLMIGFGVGGMLMGRLADRFGVTVPCCIGAVGLGLGFVPRRCRAASGLFALAHGVLIGLWAARPPSRRCWPTPRCGLCAPRHRGGGVRQRQLPGRRHLAAHRAALCAKRGLARHLHRAGHLLRLAMLALAQRHAPAAAAALAAGNGRSHRRSAVASSRPFGLSPGAGPSRCCAWPAWPAAWPWPCRRCTSWPTCTDLGFGAARGAEMLSLMLACGIVSRLVSGAICDRIGGCARCCWARRCRAWRCCCSAV
jgi:MFS family permease